MKEFTIQDIETIVHHDETRVMEAKEKIATALFKGGEMEGWGRGIPDIYDLCKAAGMPEPEFDFVPNFVCLTIKFKTPITSYVSGDVNGDVNETVSETVSETVNETVNETANATANATVKLNKTQQKILAILHENKYATYEEIAKQLNMARATVGRNIDTLKKENVIKRVGGDKNGSWEVLIDVGNYSNVE